MILQIDWKKLIISLLIPLGVGGLSAFISRKEMDMLETVNKPPLSPAGWLFPVVWTILYILMGISLYLISVSKADDTSKKTAYIIFGIQLFLNFLYSPVFFNMQQFLLAFFILLVLWVMIIVMITVFYKISKLSAVLQIPYLLWVTFAGYLTLGIYLLNR